jgi:hypothetical protein
VGGGSFGGSGGRNGTEAAAAAAAVAAAAAAAAAATATAVVAKAWAKVAKICRYHDSLQSSLVSYSLLSPSSSPLPSAEVSNVIRWYLVSRKNKARTDLTSCKLSVLHTRLSNAKRLAMLALSEKIRRNPTSVLMAAIWPTMVSAITPQDGGGGGGGGGAGGKDGLSTSTTTTTTTSTKAVVVDGGVVEWGRINDDDVRPLAAGGGGDYGGMTTKTVEVDKVVRQRL